MLRSIQPCGIARCARFSAVRHDPEKELLRAVTPFDGSRLAWRPVAHVVHIGDDTRAGLELSPQFRARFQIHRRREKQRNDGRVAEIGFKQVLVQENDSISDAGALGVRAAFADAPWIDVHANTACAALLRRCNHNPSIAAAQVEYDIGRADLR